MDRRIFLFGGAAGAAVLTRRAFAKDACLHDLKKSNLTVGTQGPGGHLNNRFQITSWEMNFEEDDKVLFDVFVSNNSGAKRVRAVHCQPFALGNWKVRTEFSAVDPGKQNVQVMSKWRADNDSNFFFIEIETTPGHFDVMDPGAGSTNANMNPQLTICHMEWHGPQQVVVEVRATDTRR